MKRFLMLLCTFAVVLSATGCSLVDGFVSGWNEGISEAVAENSADNNASESTDLKPHSDEELKTFLENQAYRGMFYTKIARFTGYEYKTGIPIYNFSQREKINSYFMNLTDEAAQEKSYLLIKESSFFKGNSFSVKKPDIYDYDESPMFYVGEVNSNSQPDGIGMIVAYLPSGSLVPDSMPYTIALTYMGEFKNGKKEGYGVQFYIPDKYYMAEAAGDLAYFNVTETSGLSEWDEGYDDALASLYSGIMGSYVNCAIYEGEFKDNEFSGKGNYNTPYTSEGDEFTYLDESETWRFADTDFLRGYYLKKDILMMSYLYVGTFKDGKPSNAKLYTNDTLNYDGEWKDFEEPK